jgi:hypothetical protein
VGKKNYHLFIALLFFVLAFSFWQCVANIVVMAVINANSYYSLVGSFYSLGYSSTYVFSYILLTLCTVCQGVFVVLVLQLLLLHHWLAKYDLTTYDYITYLRAKKEDPSLELDLKALSQSHKSKLVVDAKQVPEEIKIRGKEENKADIPLNVKDASRVSIFNKNPGSAEKERENVSFFARM